MNYNEEQLNVLNSKDKKIFLLSGAGTGKTTTVIGKIRMILNEGILPSEILAISFTRKSAKELCERIDMKEIKIRTFHSFCYQELSNYHKKTFNLLSDDAKEIETLDLTKISKYKNGGLSIKPIGYSRYQKYLSKNNLIDFDDMQNMILDDLENDKLYLLRLQTQYKYIFVDEFQDTNKKQYQLLKLLATPSTYLFAVGDPDQSIYSFRGASPNIIEKYISDFRATVYTLSYNYRSSPKIIKLANNLISHNEDRIDKELISKSKEKPTIETLSFASLETESNYIIKRIRYLNQIGISSQEIAVLYRTHRRGYTLINKLKDSFINGVHLISIHQAKGLEFQAVIILGIEEETIPNSLAVTHQEIEEERRLFFVAITRAKKVLILTKVKANSRGNKPNFEKELEVNRVLLDEPVINKSVAK